MLVAAGLHVLPAAASPSSPAASQIAALARSAAAKNARTSLSVALAQPAVAHYTESLLKHYKGSLTPIQTDLLRVSLLFGRPSVRAALSNSSAGHRLTRSQLKLIAGVLAALKRDPAVALLKRKGRELKHDPRALAADLAALGHQERPSGSLFLALNGFPRYLAKVLASPSVKTVAERLKTILSLPSAVKYISTLPPLVLGSLTPPSQLASALPASHGAPARGAALLSPEATARVNYWLQVVNAALASHVQDIGADLAGEGLGLVAGEVLGAAFVLPAAALVVGGWALYSGYQAWQDAEDINATRDTTLNPARLAVTGSSTELPAEAVATYSVRGVDTENRDVGPVSFTLSIIPDGFCSGNTCHATTAGKHTVVAADGDARGYASLNVTPGPITGLFFTPIDTTIPPNHSQTYSLEGVDYWQNPIRPVEFGSGPGQATLTITEGVCVGDTCIPNSVGLHTVTATDGNVTKTTTLTVDGIHITTTHLKDATEGAEYNEPLQATGGQHPLWEVTSGTLPAGLSLDPTSGVITGKPLAAGVSNFTVTVSDDLGATDAATFSLNVTQKCNGGVCAVADGSGEVTVSWAQCGCGISPEGPNGYFLAGFVNGVWSGFWAVFYPGSGFEQPEIRADGREYFTFAGGFWGQKAGDTMYFTLSAKPIQNPNSETTSLGTSNTVVIQ